MTTAWLKFFRVVNLPTVPGDVWVGAVAAWAGVGIVTDYGTALFNATVASACLYLYGLADNDIVGAKTDRDRPIPEGRISLTAARIARALCLLAVLLVGHLPDPVAGRPLPSAWWVVASLLLLSIVLYNRTKLWWLMGVCRGLNVASGAAAAIGAMTCYPDCSNIAVGDFWALWLVALVWTGYIAAVTKYSEGEELDEAKRRRVGFLVGAIVYLQITALLLFRSGIVIVMAVLLVVLRLLKRLLPEVSAS